MTSLRVCPLACNYFPKSYAPIVKKRVHANQLPWINVQIKRAIQLRNKLYRKYRLSRNDETWESYRVQRNLVTKLKRISIKRFFLDSSANTTTPGDFWKRVKPLLPSSGQDNSDGTCIMDRGAVVSDPSNLFNEHFSSPVLDRAVLTKSVCLKQTSLVDLTTSLP